MNSTAYLVIAVIVAVQFLEVQCDITAMPAPTSEPEDQQCATREHSRACYTSKDRTSCLKSTESRHVVANGVQIFGTECVWCPSGPCTSNNGNRCEPKNWLEAQNINGFEICGKKDTTIETKGPTTCFDVGLTTKRWGYEISWSIGTDGHQSVHESDSFELIRSSGHAAEPGHVCTSNRRYGNWAYFTQLCCFNGGTHNIIVTCTDSYGDGWNGGYLEINGQRYCDNFRHGKQIREHLTLGAHEAPGEAHEAPSASPPAVFVVPA